MKKVFLTLGLFAGSLAFANTNTNFDSQPSKLIVKHELKSQTISLKLDLGDITNLSKEEISNRVQAFLLEKISNEDELLECEVSVTASLTVGVATGSITVKVKGDYSKIKQEAKEIVDKLIDDLRKALTDKQVGPDGDGRIGAEEEGITEEELLRHKS
ncbi:conserved exported protein of unknown function [Tenacibaculum sp. 190524A02b]|uniref:hypothetical protein n=1 Tax=Tenacibaculum vairaonense TaxID=3137860 RepID=UPI0032B1935B